MQKQPQKQKLTIDGPAGELEALLETPQDGDPLAVAVVCHPHPLHGGTLQNKVAHTLARSFSGLDFAALRFNFRGVGTSQGKFDDGIGEQSDVIAAIDWIRSEYPQLELWLAGFSFGAAMAIHVAAGARPAGLISVAPAVSRFVGDAMAQPECPWLIIQGDQDELVDVDETIAWLNELEPGPQLEVFAGAEHFFHGKLIDLRGAVQNFVRDNLDSADAGTKKPG